MNDLDRLLGARDTNRCEIQIYNYHNLFFIFEQKKKERNKNETESFHRSSPYRKEKCEQKKNKYINGIHNLIESY
jgi:hypothetical protein